MELTVCSPVRLGCVCISETGRPPPPHPCVERGATRWLCKGACQAKLQTPNGDGAAPRSERLHCFPQALLACGCLVLLLCKQPAAAGTARCAGLVHTVSRNPLPQSLRRLTPSSTGRASSPWARARWVPVERGCRLGVGSELRELPPGGPVIVVALRSEWGCPLGVRTRYWYAHMGRAACTKWLPTGHGMAVSLAALHVTAGWQGCTGDVVLHRGCLPAQGMSGTSYVTSVYGQRPGARARRPAVFYSR